jgi:ParB/RepB/Spo0J family partition protein
MLATVKPEYRELALSLIDEPTLPSRTTMDEQQMDALVASIRELGFISVIVVVLVGARYEVVAGHRRRIAAGRAGLVAVPCLIYPSKVAALDAIQHAENKHREALNPADEAIWFSQLFEAHPEEGTDGVAARVGESRGYVEGLLSLLSGDDKVFADLAAGRINKGVAQQLNRCTDALHRNMLRHNAVHQGATVGVVNSWVREWKRNVEPYITNPIAPGDGGSGGPVLANVYFRCVCCDGTDDVPHMHTLQVHDYCIKSQLTPALAAFRNRSDFVAFPRTRDDAVALIERVFERFPEIGTSNT